jgi:RNA polymerase sporulation-specific sigma factor
MIRYVMNDYELIYLIQCHHDHIAFDYLYKKYERFIWKNVHLLHLDHNELDDFFQEGILMLLKATQTFDESKNKTFTRYFELILKRQFYHLCNKLPTYELNEDACLYESGKEEETIELPTMTFSSKLEQDVYDMHFIKAQKIKVIAVHLGVNQKAIYNAIYRIKEKYKNVL